MEEEIIDTSGFYKNENGTLIFGPNSVLNKDFELHREEKDTYEYPVEGFHWFDSEAEARTFFNL